MVVLTDGVDEASLTSVHRLLEILTRANTTLYAALFVPAIPTPQHTVSEARRRIKRVAEATGRLVLPVEHADPTRALTPILRDFEATYRLGFRPTPGKKFRN